MRDEWFIRGKVPMTKSEVRTVSLSKLELYEDCEFWDIGAGTGSVSVEAAVSCPGIHVCAFEYKEEAVRKPEQRRSRSCRERRRRHLHR